MTTEMMYDPPSGWRYGFPKVYRPVEGETVEDTLERDGYPRKMADDFGGKYCRFWHAESQAKPAKNWDSVARRYVEHDTLPQETFGVWPFGRDGSNGDHIEPANDNLRQVAPTAATERKGNNKDRGPYITTYTGRFYMFDPRPEDWNIADVAHGLANICRYTGAGTLRYAVAEHSVHVYRELKTWGYPPEVQLAGLMHDAPESLSGFGDAASPAKKRAPIIKDTEDNIWRKAIAPKLSLPLEMPEAVHIIDMRICADEMSQNLWEVDPKVGPPLGVTLEYWEPARAEAEFLRAFEHVQNMRVAYCTPNNDDHYQQQDREASAADRAYQMAKEEA